MRHPNRFIFPILLLATMPLYACKNAPEQAPAKAALLTCTSVASALDLLYPFRRDGKLGKTVVDLIDRERAISDPYCEGPAPDVNSSVKDIAVDGVARTLGGILASVGVN